MGPNCFTCPFMRTVNSTFISKKQIMFLVNQSNTFQLYQSMYFKYSNHKHFTILLGSVRKDRNVRKYLLYKISKQTNNNNNNNKNDVVKS